MSLDPILAALLTAAITVMPAILLGIAAIITAVRADARTQELQRRLNGTDHRARRSRRRADQAERREQLPSQYQEPGERPPENPL